MSTLESSFRKQLPLTVRHFIQLCSYLGLCTFLAACGGGGGENPPPPPTPDTPGLPAAYSIHGRVQGLAEGSTLVVLLNGQPTLSVAADGEFQLAHSFRDGDSYQLSVGAPVGPIAQTCSVHAGTGQISGANVANVAISCSTLAYKLGGQVSGLRSSSLVLESKAGERIVVVEDGRFEFSRPITSGSEYAVTIAEQPGGILAQTCTVGHGFGMVSMNDITDVRVVCSTNTYKIGGAVLGLHGSGLQLQLNGAAVVFPEADKPFVFEEPLASGANYLVTVKAQPTAPAQTCSAFDGSGFGIVGRNDLNNVLVVCSTNSYAVGGMVEGLVGTGLVLHNNGTDDLPISSNGFFAFPRKVASGGSYAISVRHQPDRPRQTCSANAGHGQISDAEASGARVVCSTLDYPVTVQVNGLRPGQRGLVLRNNGTDDLLVLDSGPATFEARLISYASYAVTVAQQPTSSAEDTGVCTVRPGTASGTIIPEIPAIVVVDCAPDMDVVIIRVSGLSGAGLTLKESTQDRSRELAVDGEYRLRGYPSGSQYVVTVDQHPPAEWCFISGGAGIAGGRPSVVDVRCSARAGKAALLLSRGDNQLALHVRDETGQWRYLVSTPTGGIQPEGIALSPSRKYAYVSHVQSPFISTFEVDVAAGTLRRIGLTPTHIARPAALYGGRLLLHPSGRFLYLEGFEGGLLGFSIDATTGIPTSNGPGQPVVRNMVLDQDGRFGHVISNAGWIHSFEIDSTNGNVVPLPNETIYFRFSLFAPLVMAPSGNYLLGRFSDFDANQGIVLYRRDAASGFLLEESDQAPQVFSFSHIGSVAAMSISPTGRYLAFVLDSEGALSKPTIHFALLDPGTGQLTYSAELGHQAAWVQSSLSPHRDSAHWNLTFDPTEDFVYAIRLGRENVDVYAIDPRNGSITPSGTIRGNTGKFSFSGVSDLVVFDVQPETPAQANARMRKSLELLTRPSRASH